jgi:hypothetical protein
VTTFIVSLVVAEGAVKVDCPAAGVPAVGGLPLVVGVPCVVAEVRHASSPPLCSMAEAARMPVGTDEERADLLLSVRRFAIKHGSEDAC